MCEGKWWFIWSGRGNPRRIAGIEQWVCTARREHNGLAVTVREWAHTPAVVRKNGPSSRRASGFGAEGLCVVVWLLATLTCMGDTSTVT